MANLSQAIRPKRFYLKKSSNVELSISTPKGEVVKMRLENCSLGGVGAALEVECGGKELEVGDIQPAAKLSWDGQELVLGRVVVRSKIPRSDKTFFGFSLVDTKFPVDGVISRQLDITSDKGLNPFEFELSPNKFNLASFHDADQTNVDLFGKCRQFAVLHHEWAKSPKFQYRTLREPSMGTRVKLQRRRANGRQDYVVFGSNDYWGLASHPKVIEAAETALKQYGFGSTGSPVTTGNTIIHEELSDYLARLFNKDKVILYNSGYNANVGAITALVSDRDLMVADILSHMSIQNGMEMARGTSRFFKHNSTRHLERLLSKEREKFSGSLILTEGIFSMDGDHPPLDKIIEIAKAYNSRTFVDEAHSFGVLGPTGLGACERYDVMRETDIIMGTFSKLCGGIGGFVAADGEVIDWLYFYSKAHMFSVSLPPSNAAAVLAALKIFRDQNEELQILRERIRHFVEGLRHLGCPIEPDHESTIVPVVIGDEEKLGRIHQILMDAGIYSIPIVYPAVSRNGCRFRFTIMKEHSISDIDYLLNVLAGAFREVDFQFDQQREKHLKLVNGD